MIKKIKVYSRSEMDRYYETEFKFFPHLGQKWHLISIYDIPEVSLIDENSKKVFGDSGCQSFLSLQFSDITDKNYEHIKETRDDIDKYTLFSNEQARQVIEFIGHTIEVQDDAVLVVHCSAGISRSGAIATFANDYFKLDYKTFLTDNSYIHANPWVITTLRRESGMTPSFGTHDGVN